jgi:ribulose kinase
MRCEESTSLGTAVLAAAGTGLKASLEDAIQTMVHPAETVQPSGTDKGAYEVAFRKYRELNRRIFS